MPLLLFILWIILNGRITIEIILFGIAVSFAVSWFSFRVLGWKPSTDAALFSNALVLLLYLLNLLLEIVKSSSAVIELIVSRRKKPDPIIVEFDSEFTSSFVNVLLANSITLTPGTYTVFHKKNHFAVHCLVPEFADGIEESSFVRILRKLR